MKIYKCTLCKYTSKDKHQMGQHYHLKHRDSIRPDMTGYQYFYWLLTGKDHGSCIVCKNTTDFNEGSMKYSRFCNNPKCKEKYREEFKNRMMSKYGKIHLLNDPNIQKKMLANRKISGTYEWSDHSVKLNFTGSYEEDFLRYIDTILHWDSSDIMFPAPHIFKYEFNGTEHFYIPDGFIPSIKLLIEIKTKSDINRNPEDHQKNLAKYKMMESVKNYFDYIVIYDKDYTEFNKLIKQD